MKLMPKARTPLGMLAEAVGVTIGCYIAIPLNCSIYPQFRDIEVSKLEPEIQEAARTKGIKVLQYNKGM